MQRVTCVVFINLTHYYGKRIDRASRARGQLAISLVHWPRSQTDDRGIWPGNETTCAHVYNIRKWRPSQRTAATECCEWLFSTRVNLRLKDAEWLGSCAL